jgi:hypothetical protein
MIACVDIIELLMSAENARFFVDLYLLFSKMRVVAGNGTGHVALKN